MPNRTSYSEALNHEVFRTISSTPETSFNCAESSTHSSGSISSTFKWLLPGEEIKIEDAENESDICFCVSVKCFMKRDILRKFWWKENDVGYSTIYGKVYGKVYVTNYRLKFEEYYDPVNGSKSSEYQDNSFDITLGSISKVEKIGFSNVSRGEGSYGIEVTCKDMRNVRFLHKPETHSRRPLYDCLQKFAFPNTNKLPFFATVYKQHFNWDGWNLYSAEREFKRQKMPKSAWAITRINADYEFAATYSAVLSIPAEIASKPNADEILRNVAEYRSKHRIPVLSWIDSKTCAAIVRSSQPLVGVTSRKSPYDEEFSHFGILVRVTKQYLESIINANPNSSHLIILDARPSVNAKANRAKGGGYEAEYPRCELTFLDIQNIHAVRESLKRLKDACFPQIDHKHFNRALDETKWLLHLQTILDGATRVVQEVGVRRNSVLVHCSDGWDRTSQLTALAMLQLDAYYRTIEGFAVLVEKEWCSFGHKFAHRVGHGEDKHGDGERSPIFVQFIDCVWQLFNQFTSCFEFNVKFLKTILDELYACRFGTFLYNNEKERRDLEVKKRTVSLWSFILEHRHMFENAAYDPGSNVDDFQHFVKTPICTKLWAEYHCRYNPQVILPERDDDDGGDEEEDRCDGVEASETRHCSATTLQIAIEPSLASSPPSRPLVSPPSYESYRQQQQRHQYYHLPQQQLTGDKYYCYHNLRNNKEKLPESTYFDGSYSNALASPVRLRSVRAETATDEAINVSDAFLAELRLCQRGNNRRAAPLAISDEDEESATGDGRYFYENSGEDDVVVEQRRRNNTYTGGGGLLRTMLPSIGNTSSATTAVVAAVAEYNRGTVAKKQQSEKVVTRV